MTIMLEKNAIINASTNPIDYPLIPPLPSYGKARDNARFTDKVHSSIF